MEVKTTRIITLFLIVAGLIHIDGLLAQTSKQSLDFRGVYYFNRHSTPFLDTYAGFTNATAVPISAIVPCAIGIAGLIEHDDAMIAQSTGMLIGLAMTTAITYTTKHFVARPRPYSEFPNDIIPTEQLYSNSFPSGHTSAAFTCATSLTLYYPKWYVAVPAFLWAGSVGYSRMHAGVHYPSDVLAGAAIGAGSAYVSYLINKAIWKKVDKKKQLKSLAIYAEMGENFLPETIIK